MMYVDHELVTYRDSYPGVAAWLEGADTGHWWAWVLDVPRDPRVTPPTREDMALGTMEILVRAVQGASPEGMSLFIASRFRDPNLANVLSARLELLCAANLAACRVPFAFGGKGEPDLTWNPGTDAPGWLEIHRGGFSVFDDLEQELDRDLGSKGAVLRIRLGEWPLEVRDRNLLRTRVSDATDAALATGQEQRVTMAELGPGATGIIAPARPSSRSAGSWSRHPGSGPPMVIWQACPPGWPGRSTWTRRRRAARATGIQPDRAPHRHLHRPPSPDARARWPCHLARRRCRGMGRPALRCGRSVLQPSPRPVSMGKVPVPARPRSR